MDFKQAYKDLWLGLLLIDYTITFVNKLLGDQQLDLVFTQEEGLHMPL